MAATARVTSAFEMPAPDAMDLHSDNGLDFADGDIDLDLELVQATGRFDDDVSINDATTDTGAQAQATPIDQDDDMIDDEDVIEEDGVQYEDRSIADLDTSDNRNQLQSTVPIAQDEDLIDYLDDDEEQQYEDDHVPSLSQHYHDNFEPQHVETSVHESEVAEDVQVYQFPGEEQHDAHNEHIEGEFNFQHTEAEQARAPDQIADEDVGSVPHAGDKNEEITVSELDIHGDNEHNESNDDDQQVRPLESRPITVNYEGNELWLCKEHDAEDSGDWLLEDTKSMNSSLSDFFQACRLALGEDISPETELGLRFDHLHQMEIYEDNTACVAISLTRLVGLYYTLHAQDGNNDPEYFYMSLLSRPRFASLLSDVARHAEEDRGYYGLEAAILAGETHFPETYSGDSTEHEQTEWENDQEGEQGHENTQSPTDYEHEDSKAQEISNEDEKEEVEAEYHEQVDGHYEDAYEANADGEIEQEEDKESVSHANANVGEDVDHHNGTSTDGTSQDDSHSERDMRAEIQEEDTVEYDDDEGEEEQSPIDASSPSSNTAQGDAHEAIMSQTAFYEQDQSAVHETDQADDIHYAADDNLDSRAPSYEQTGDNHARDSHKDLDPLYAENDQREGIPGTGEEYQSNEPDLEGYTNEEYIDYTHPNIDERSHENFLDNDHDYQDASDTAVEFDGAHDILGFSKSSEWNSEEAVNELVPNDASLLDHDDYAVENGEEEDGVVEQPEVAASPVADAALALSGLNKMSPQGLKRSINEISDVEGEALDPSGTKRLRV